MTRDFPSLELARIPLSLHCDPSPNDIKHGLASTRSLASKKFLQVKCLNPLFADSSNTMPINPKNT